MSAPALTRWHADHPSWDGCGCRRQLGSNDSLHVVDADEDVFRLKVRVNDAALVMQIVKPLEDLLRDLLADSRRDAPVLVPLDEAQEVLAKDLKDHADVRSMRAKVAKVVEQLDDVASTRVVQLGRTELIQQLNLVKGRLCVVLVGLDDLEGDVPSGAGRMQASR